MNTNLAGPGLQPNTAGRALVDRRAGLVRLRTLVLVRWLGVAGQTLAILLVHFGLGYELPLLPALALVAASALLNIALGVGWSAATRINNSVAALLLSYDVLQLAGLLYLAGGLKNPFALLFLGPVTISATNLSLGSTVWLAALVIASVSFLGLQSEPLPWPDGEFVLPGTYLVGSWVALVLGTVFISAYAWRMAEESRRMSNALSATQLALAREQRLSALGGMAAAAAHELGTPLGTIAVVAKELSLEVPPDGPLAEDMALLLSQANRCRGILARLSQRPEEEGDTAFNRMPIATLVEMAAVPYQRNGIVVDIVGEGPDSTQPMVPRSPEIIHGLGNLIENAVDFAHSKVRIHVDWPEQEARISIRDDGPGLSLDVLSGLGEPYMTTRPESGGMGLGVFIAKTLLERTGAILRFANRSSGGAEVVIIWPRDVLDALEETAKRGQNETTMPMTAGAGTAKS